MNRALLFDSGHVCLYFQKVRRRTIPCYKFWIPDFAGMTEENAGVTKKQIDDRKGRKEK